MQWKRPQVENETGEYFENEETKSFLLDKGIEFQTEKSLVEALRRGHIVEFTREELAAEDIHNLTVYPEGFKQELSDPDYAESFHQMKSDDSAVLPMPILLKIGTLYYGLAGNRRANLGWENGDSVPFWVVPITKGKIAGRGQFNHEYYVDFVENAGKPELAHRLENLIDDGASQADVQNFFIRNSLIPRDVDLGFVGKVDVALTGHAIFRAIERKPLENKIEMMDFINQVDDWSETEAKGWNIPIDRLPEGKVHKKVFRDGRVLLLQRSGNIVNIFGYQPKDMAMAASTKIPKGKASRKSTASESPQETRRVELEELAKQNLDEHNLFNTVDILIDYGASNMEAEAIVIDLMKQQAVKEAMAQRRG